MSYEDTPARLLRLAGELRALAHELHHPDPPSHPDDVRMRPGIVPYVLIDAARGMERHAYALRIEGQRDLLVDMPLPDKKES